MHKSLNIKLLIVGFLTTSLVEASYVEDLWNKISSYTDQAESENTEIDYWDLSLLDWSLFAGGILIGLSESLATEGIDNRCIADSANIVVSAFHTKEYMDDFIETNKTDTTALTYSMVYFVSGWEAT